jgi:hypothetical protein
MALDTVVAGRIATFAGDAGYGWVEAIGIRGGTVVAAGTAAEVEAAADARTRRIELAPGEVALPGMTDAHIHLVDTAIAAQSLDLFAAPTLDAALELVADAAARIPAPGWILGSGWDQRRWGGWPHADMLERVAPGRHVALRSFDLHALWASPAALAAAGIDSATPDPTGGIIRRSADGRPDGIMFEKASELVLGRVPPPTGDVLRRAIRVIGLECLALGVVGAHELGTLFPTPRTSPSTSTPPSPTPASCRSGSTPASAPTASRTRSSAGSGAGRASARPIYHVSRSVG